MRERMKDRPIIRLLHLYVNRIWKLSVTKLPVFPGNRKKRRYYSSCAVRLNGTAVCQKENCVQEEKMYNPFTFYAPTKVFFGPETEKKAGECIREFGGSSVLLLYGSKRIAENGLLETVEKSVRAAGLKLVSMGGVVPNPHLSLVRKAIETGKEHKVDFILAIGGGSVIDTAKAVAYGLADERDVWELYERKRQATACLPVGAILTIAAAGSEMSNSSVITNELTQEKRSYNDDISRPRFAIMNPDLTTELPDWQSMSGCADMMMHTLERYLSNNGHMEVTDAISEGILRTIMKYARILHVHPEDKEARAEVMWASSLSHNNLTGCGNDGGDFSSHLLEHELGGFYDVTHGAGLTAVWGSWARYVVGHCLDRFVRLATNVMDIPLGEPEQTALRGIEAMEAFFKEIGMPVSLHELGLNLTEQDIRMLASSCAKACGGKKGSARVLMEEDMAEIYRMAR